MASIASASSTAWNGDAPIWSLEPPRPSEPFTLDDDIGRPIEVYPPSSTATDPPSPLAPLPRAPLIIVLHATCMEPSSVCDAFGGAGGDGWLVCPSGNSTCANEPDWHGPGAEKAAFLERAVEHVQEAIPSFIDDRPGVLIGWSRGAYAARDIIYSIVDDAKYPALHARFRGLVLIAAQVTPDWTKLRAAGITRVVMAVGDYDGARSTMIAAVAKLQKGGIEARYVSLGKIGHAWPVDFAVRMREPIAWAGGAD